MSRGTSQQSMRRHAVVVMGLGLSLVGGVGGWAAMTTLSNAVVAQGTVIINDNPKKIQHLTGGTVSELLVQEGSHVAAGDVLVRLDGATAQANLAIVNNTLAQLYARRSRLEAERAGLPDFSVEDLAVSGLDGKTVNKLVLGERQLFEARRSAQLGMKKQLEERKSQLAEEIQGDTLQLRAIEDSLKLVEEELKATDQLYQQKLVTLPKINSLKRQKVELEGSRGERLAARAQAEGKINEINLQILQLEEDRRTESARDLTDVEGKIAEMEERRINNLDQLKRLDIRAPVGGRVYQLAVHTIGGIVNPSEVLMLLAPDQRDLTLEAKISSRDIDQLQPGQRVDVRFSAFDQKTTPLAEGEVLSISPDIVTEERTGTSYYPVRVRPSPASLSKLKGMSLYPGMPAEIFIKVADRSVISYLVKPLSDQMSHTFREE